MTDLPNTRSIPPPPEGGADPLIYRIAVSAAGGVLVLSTIGIIALALLGKAVPEGLIAIASALVGVVAGMLVQRPAG